MRVSSRARWPAGDSGDLHLRTAEEGRAHGGPDRPRLGEVPLIHGVEALELGQVSEVDQAGHDVGERAAGRVEQRGDLAERVLGNRKIAPWMPGCAGTRSSATGPQVLAKAHNNAPTPHAEPPPHAAAPSPPP